MSMTSLRRRLNWVILITTAVAAMVTAPSQALALTLQQEAGQRIIYSYTGLTPPASLIQRIQSGQAAGVIFFGDNISSDNQISSVVTELRQADAQSPVHAPLLLMTDQEGGEVRRLPGSPVLSEKQIGESANPVSAAGQAGHDAGENLRSVGMNVNLAPVLDVFYQPGNFIDEFQRSYSNNPNTVSSLGQAMISNQQAQGAAATAKHFPGLGSATTSQNTDSVPVTLNLSLNQLRSTDEAPYPAAIAAGVQLIMVSWAVYPALDSKNPAGLSPTIVQGELRNRLGYQGVTITDAIEAGALRSFGSDGNRSVLAAQAGMDLILCANGSVSQGDGVNAALVSALQNGQLSQSSFDGAVNRITALRNSLP